jgi:hypothetical protein
MGREDCRLKFGKKNRSLCGAISFQNIGTPYMEDHPHTE